MDPVNVEPTFASVQLDFGPALERLGGDDSLLKRQMSFFLREAPKLAEQLHASIRSTDAGTARIVAHRLKGLFSSYDHQEAVHVAQQLERYAEDNRLSEASPLAALLACHIDELSAAIRRYCGKPP